MQNCQVALSSGALQRLPKLFPSFARIVISLSHKLQIGQHKEFGVLNEEGLTAMMNLQNKTYFSPIPALPYVWEHFTFGTDARNVQVGCKLLQDQPDIKKNQLTIGRTHWQNKIRLTSHLARVSNYRFVCTTSTFVPQRYTVHQSNWL